MREPVTPRNVPCRILTVTQCRLARARLEGGARTPGCVRRSLDGEWGCGFSGRGASLAVRTIDAVSSRGMVTPLKRLAHPRVESDARVAIRFVHSTRAMIARTTFSWFLGGRFPPHRQ